VSQHSTQESRARYRRGIVAVALCAAAAWLAGAAQGSVMVALDARDPSLQIDASGNALVSWTTADGGRRSLEIDRNGSLRYGGSEVGADVSHPTGAVSLPWAVAVRQTADGSFYALQAWQRLAGHPVELRFSRWKGDPTRLTLGSICCKWGGETISGAASFHDQAIFGMKATRSGVPLDPYGRNVYLDSFQNGHWERMMGILTHRGTGAFSLWIRPNWAGTRYRGTISGPNDGWTIGPDALAEATSSRSQGAG
jgi:hypothetical protein